MAEEGSKTKIQSKTEEKSNQTEGVNNEAEKTNEQNEDRDESDGYSSFAEDDPQSDDEPQKVHKAKPYLLEMKEQKDMCYGSRRRRRLDRRHSRAARRSKRERRSRSRSRRRR